MDYLYRFLVEAQTVMLSAINSQDCCKSQRQGAWQVQR